MICGLIDGLWIDGLWIDGLWIGGLGFNQRTLFHINPFHFRGSQESKPPGPKPPI